MNQVRRTQGEQTGADARSRSVAAVTVTIRMPAEMVEALKREAERQGVRGYQTLLKLWIEDRLAGDRVVSARRLTPVLQNLLEAERELRMLMAEAIPDH